MWNAKPLTKSGQLFYGAQETSYSHIHTARHKVLYLVKHGYPHIIDQECYLEVSGAANLGYEWNAMGS